MWINTVLHSIAPFNRQTVSVIKRYGPLKAMSLHVYSLLPLKPCQIAMPRTLSHVDSVKCLVSRGYALNR